MKKNSVYTRVTLCEFSLFNGTFIFWWKIVTFPSINGKFPFAFPHLLHDKNEIILPRWTNGYVPFQFRENEKIPVTFS